MNAITLSWEDWRAVIAVLREKPQPLPYMLDHADHLEQQLEQHAPDQPMVMLGLTDDVYLRMMSGSGLYCFSAHASHPEGHVNANLAVKWLTPVGSIAGRFTHPLGQPPLGDEVCHSTRSMTASTTLVGRIVAGATGLSRHRVLSRHPEQSAVSAMGVDIMLAFPCSRHDHGRLRRAVQRASVAPVRPAFGEANRVEG